MSNHAKWLRVRVTDLNTGESKTNVKIPAGLASFGLRMAAKYAPESIEGLELDQVRDALKNGGEPLLVDVEDLEKGERVEVFVE